MVATGNYKSPAAWIDPKHDFAGNMTLAPRPGSEATASEGLLCVYDAWNRLVEVWRDDGSGSTGTLIKTGGTADTQLAEYRYDPYEQAGRHRRIKKFVVVVGRANWPAKCLQGTVS